MMTMRVPAIGVNLLPGMSGLHLPSAANLNLKRVNLCFQTLAPMARGLETPMMTDQAHPLCRGANRMIRRHHLGKYDFLPVSTSHTDIMQSSSKTVIIVTIVMLSITAANGYHLKT